MGRSQKHKDFIRDAMVKTVDSPITSVPGVGDAIGTRLYRAGITSAKALYGCYLTNKRGFKELIASYGGNVKHQEDAIKAMRDWDVKN